MAARGARVRCGQRRVGWDRASTGGLPQQRGRSRAAAQGPAHHASPRHERSLSERRGAESDRLRSPAPGCGPSRLGAPPQPCLVCIRFPRCVLARRGRGAAPGARAKPATCQLRRQRRLPPAKLAGGRGGGARQKSAQRSTVWPRASRACRHTPPRPTRLLLPAGRRCCCCVGRRVSPPLAPSPSPASLRDRPPTPTSPPRPCRTHLGPPVRPCARAHPPRRKLLVHKAESHEASEAAHVQAGALSGDFARARRPARRARRLSRARGVPPWKVSTQRAARGSAGVEGVGRAPAAAVWLAAAPERHARCARERRAPRARDKRAAGSPAADACPLSHNRRKSSARVRLFGAVLRRGALRCACLPDPSPRLTPRKESSAWASGAQPFLPPSAGIARAQPDATRGATHPPTH